MTHRILKSTIASVPDFDVEVAAHAAAMKHWRAHMARVKEDEANGVTGIDKHAPYGRPMAHHAVAAAVNENDEADFDVVDDTLEPRKTALMDQVNQAEQSAIAAAAPRGKRRLFQMREADIRAADTERATELLRTSTSSGGFLGLFKSKAPAVDIDAMVAEQRPAEDTVHLKEQDTRRERIHAIERIAAQAYHDIEDLTLETIDAWTMPDFN